jgi:tight adherence protein B
VTCDPAILVGVGSLSMAWTGWALASGWTWRLPSLSLPTRDRWKASPHGVLVLGTLLTLAFCVLLGPWVLPVAGLLLAKTFQGSWRLLRADLDRHRTTARIKELFPQALGMAVQALRTGQTLPQTLSYLSQECLPPLREEFSQACSQIGLGASAETALAQLAQRRPGIPEFSRLLESYRISRTTGANLAELLQTLLEGMEEKNRLFRKMESMTAQARLSGTLMGLLPVVLATFLTLMDPLLMRPLFTEPAGWGILGLSVLLEGLGFLWIRHLLRLEALE